MRRTAASYTFNAGPYTSHTLLLSALPARGEGRALLDVGCADGYLGEILDRRGYVVTGIDLPRAHRNGFPPSVRLIEADLDRGLPALEGTFDYIVCADVLEHLRDPAACLAELAGALGGSGRILASLPNSGHIWFRLNVLAGRFPQSDHGLFDRTHLRFYTWRGWRDLFASAGFTFDEVRCSGVPVRLALPRMESTLAVRFLEWLSFVSARLWKTLFAYQFVVTARREPAP